MNISEKNIIPVTMNASADIDQKERNDNVSVVSQTLSSESGTMENIVLEKPNLDSQSKNVSVTTNTNGNNCFTHELVTPQFIATEKERPQVFETIDTTEKVDVIETSATPKTMSQSMVTLEEAKAINQLLATPDQITAFNTILEKINSQSISNSINLNIPETTLDKLRGVVIDKILIPAENVNVPFLKQAIFEKIIKNSPTKATSSNLNANNGSTNAKMSNLPIAKVKPMPTNDSSRKDDIDDDIEILEEIIDVDNYRPKSYTEAFVTPDGCIVDLNSQVIGHLNPEKAKGISFKPGEPLITLRKDDIQYVSKAGCSTSRDPLSNDGTGIILEGSCTSKKIDKPKEGQTSCENKGTEIKDSNERELRKKSLNKKPKNVVVEKRSLPVRAKKQTEKGFYKRFAEDAEEDILNASDNDCDDPNYIPVELDDPLTMEDDSNSNETNGTDSNYFEDLEMENSDAPSTSGEILSKEGTSDTKEPLNQKNRAMPLSVRLKEEEKRRCSGNESKTENINAPTLIDNKSNSNATNETDSNSIRANEMDPKLKEMENSDDASGVNQKNIPKEAESPNKKNKRAMPLSVRLKNKREEEFKCMKRQSKTDIEKDTEAPVSIGDDSHSSSSFTPDTNGTDSNCIEGNKMDPQHKEMKNILKDATINTKDAEVSNSIEGNKMDTQPKEMENMLKDVSTNSKEAELSNSIEGNKMVPQHKEIENMLKDVTTNSKEAELSNSIEGNKMNPQHKEMNNILKDINTKEAEFSNKKNKRAMPLSIRLKKKGEEKRRRVGSKSKMQIEKNTIATVSIKDNSINVREMENSDANGVARESKIISKAASTDTKETEASNKKPKRAMPLSVRWKKAEEKRRRVESESKTGPEKVIKEPALLVPKVETCDEGSVPIPKIKEAAPAINQVKREQIEAAAKVSPTFIKKEIVTIDSFVQVHDIESQSVLETELTTTPGPISIQFDGQFCSPISVENFEFSNKELINSVTSCEAARMSPEKVLDQIEIETDFSLMISNVTSLALPDEDLVGFSPAATYSMVKATRADLMKNLVAYESIFKISTRDSLKLFQHAFNSVFKKPI